jgi:hypothetical protein
MEQPLITRAELWLHTGGGLALLGAIALRCALGFLLTRDLWLLDSQLFWSCLLLAALRAAGCLLPRRYGTAASTLLGLLGWLLALSILPRYGWPTGAWPHWLLLAAGGLLLAMLALYGLLRRRWLMQLRGHGFAWMLAWAAGRPLHARLLTRQVLRQLGYREE